MDRSGRLNVYRGCKPELDVKYEHGNGKSPAEVIVYAVAEAAAVDPTELPPLYDVIDPDAIDTLFDGKDSNPDAPTILSFQIDTWNVFVRSDGRIRICDSTQTVDPEPVFESAVS